MPPTITDQKEAEEKPVISTGNSELDKRIADGLPLQFLTMIEGENDTGKSVLTQQIMYGAMKQRISVVPLTTRNTIWSFIRQIEAMSRNVSEYFAWGYLRGFPLLIVGIQWNKEEIKDIVRCLIADIGHSAVRVAII